MIPSIRGGSWSLHKPSQRHDLHQVIELHDPLLTEKVVELQKGCLRASTTTPHEGRDGNLRMWVVETLQATPCRD
ncbi:hypothetical protein SLA2020_277950 [Shorea laevis]